MGSIVVVFILIIIGVVELVNKFKTIDKTKK